MHKKTFSYLDLNYDENHTIVVRSVVRQNDNRVWNAADKVMFEGSPQELIKIIQLGRATYEVYKSEIKKHVINS